MTDLLPYSARLPAVIDGEVVPPKAAGPNPNLWPARISAVGVFATLLGGFYAVQRDGEPVVGVVAGAIMAAVLTFMFNLSRFHLWEERQS